MSIEMHNDTILEKGSQAYEWAHEEYTERLAFHLEHVVHRDGTVTPRKRHRGHTTDK